jgi:hypothetical protein
MLKVVFPPYYPKFYHSRVIFNKEKKGNISTMRCLSTFNKINRQTAVNCFFLLKTPLNIKLLLDIISREEIDNGYFDNFDNGFLNKYKKILKMKKRL